MPWNGRRFKRLPQFTAPISEMFQKDLAEEREAIRDGRTAGLDPEKEYVAIRVGRDMQMPVWVVAAVPFDPASVDGVILFTAPITLGSAIYLVEHGAEVVP